MVIIDKAPHRSFRLETRSLGFLSMNLDFLWVVKYKYLRHCDLDKITEVFNYDHVIFNIKSIFRLFSSPVYVLVLGIHFFKNHVL